MKNTVILVIFSLVCSCLFPGLAQADWKIYYRGALHGTPGAGNIFAPGIGRGSFDTQNRCEAYRKTRPLAERNDSYCAGSDAPNGANTSSSPSADTDDSVSANSNEEAENRMNSDQQRNFVQERNSLSAILKGTTRSGQLTGEGGPLKLKPATSPSATVRNSRPLSDAAHIPPTKPIDVQQVNRRIADLQRQISGIQTLLGGYSRSLRGNRSEFEKWEETVDKAYNSVLDNSKEYVAQMFLQYNLLGALERNVQKTVFVQLSAFFGSNDPALQTWLTKEIGSRQIQVSRLKKVVDVGNLSGDFASLLTGGQEETSRNLDTLLFVNSIMETGEVVKYSKMLEESKIFTELPSAYFEQAKMIGETYADLSAIAYSWYSINKLTQDVASYDREIKLLSDRMRLAMKETECLKRCLSVPENRCLDHCAGKTRLSKPPPLPR